MWESPACEWEDELMLREGSPQPEVHPKEEKLPPGSQRGKGGWGTRTGHRAEASRKPGYLKAEMCRGYLGTKMAFTGDLG